MRSYGFQIFSYHYFRRWIVHGLCMHTRHSMHAHVMDCACLLGSRMHSMHAHGLCIHTVARYTKKIEEYLRKCKKLTSASYVMLICRPTFKSRIQSNLHVQEASRNPSTSHQSGPPSWWWDRLLCKCIIFSPFPTGTAGLSQDDKQPFFVKGNISRFEADRWKASSVTFAAQR